MKKYIIGFLVNLFISFMACSATPSFTVSNIMDGEVSGTMSFTLDSCTNCLMSANSFQFYIDHTPITGGAPGTPSMSFTNEAVACNKITTSSSYDSSYLKPLVASSYPSPCSDPKGAFTTHITVHNLKVSANGWAGGAVTCQYDISQTGKRSCGSINIPPFQPTVPSCTVNSETLTVQMGDVQKTVFTGKGSTSPEKGFNLALHCNANTKVYTTVSGTADPSKVQGVIALATGTGAATGAGVQIIYNNQPVSLGTLMHLQDVISESDISVPFQARYYQTGASITGGQANATATFTMTYQ